MDRSQEKGSSSKAKLQTLDQDNLSYIEGRNGVEGVNTRKNEPLLQSYASTPGVGMGIPYMANPGMDPRALNSFFYNPQMIGFPAYPGIYGQRLANGEDMRENRSSTSTPADRSDSTRDPKEPVRTESVIKIATDRPDSRKQDSVDKRQSRPSSDEYTRQYADRNGEPEVSRNMNIYRGPRDKLDGPMITPNGDLRNTNSKQIPETSSSERTVGAFSSYPTPSVYSKSLTPVSHPGDYIPKSDYSKAVTTSSNMYATMPKLTPIAPRGFPSNFPANSAAEVSERQSMSGSVWRPPSTGYMTRDYPLTSASDALVSHRSSAGENSSRADETPELRGSYLPHSVHESSSRSQENFAGRERQFPYAWERNAAEISSRYPGHSAYQGYGYGRPFQPKRPGEKENFKETEDVRIRTSDSVKESSISPDRYSAPRYTKDASKTQSAETNKNKEQSSQNYKSTPQDISSRNQVNLSKNEKPVVPENVRYKVKDERKCVLKSDKVTVYPRQGMAYVVSVRETPQKVSDYFANGRLPNSDITAVSSESNERTQLPSSYEATSKKDEGQRHGSIREAAVKEPEKITPEGASGGDYPRRPVDTPNNDRHISIEETKKINDRNNNSSFGGYQFSGYPSQGERPRTSNRITLSQDKVFVPPNVTLEMFEKRGLEIERAAASCRLGDAARSGQFGSNVRQKPPGRKENELDVRNHSPEQMNPRIPSSKPENKGTRSDISSKSSDDEELKIIEDKTDSQQRNIRTEEKRLSSSPRLSRITSPAVTTSNPSNPPYLTPFGVNFPRRNPSDSDAAARESAERNLQAAAYIYGANMPYQTNSPYLGSNVRPDMQVMLPMDQAMFYNGLYKQHMMDPSQGGAVMQDPLTGSLVVVPEAMINPNMFNPLAAAAESQLMLDPSRFWGMQASMEDPRWQQFYQQQKQLYEHQLEKYKHEMMIAQQQGRWQGYAVHPFYQKQMEAQRKQEENERSMRTADQRPKSREEQSNQPRADKPEDSIPKEKKSSSTEERFFHDSRRDDSDNRRDSSKDFQGESRGVTSYPEKQDKVPAPVKPVNPKPPSTEYLEAREKAKEILQQEEQDRQFQQYLLREPVFNQSKFTRIPTSLSTTSSNPKSPLEVPRDRVRDLRENTRGESTQNSETRAEMSPQVVSAAATLANMDFGTRFPFNQQSSMTLENSKVSRSAEQMDASGKRSLANQNISREENAVYQSPPTGKSPTDNRPPQPMVYTSQQLYSPIKSITAVTVAPSTTHERREQSTDSSASEKGHFDVLMSSGFAREPIRTKSNSTSSQSSVKLEYHSNGEEAECSRLLVAKAEKLPQDEELEVIRIDTPFACAGSDAGDISTINRQETDLLMSLAKASNEALESPSSKSEIFWVACSDEELEDFEVRTINSSAKPKEFEGHNKENYFKLSLQNAKSEDEKKCIREKIEKLREVAKNRTREERFTALTRQKELKSPASIVHSVTSSLNEVLDMNVLEKDIRLRLADLQKKYREKHRELARLQPRGKEGNDDASGKNTPVKRGPGRPRKRKYFGASSRSGKTTPTLTSNGSLDLPNRSGASSPSSCPQSPGLKSVTSEDNSTVKEEPVKKKRKKSSANRVEERVPTLPSPPQIVSPTELELKPPRVKPSKKAPTFTPKTRIPTSTIITTSTTTSNIAKLISAISPSMLDDSSNVEKEIESITADSKTMPTKSKPKKSKKLIKQEKIPSTDEGLEDKEKMSPDSVKEICGSPTSIKTKKVKNPKKAKKKEKQPVTPKINAEFVFPATGEKVEEKSFVKQEFPKIVGAEIEKKVERESNGDSSENDEVFTACHGGGALDMLADFASSASFEKEKESERESPFEGLGKGSKRGRPKKPNSPAPESDTTPTPKKKKKKKKPSTSSTKSSKKSSTTSEEKENDFSNREVEQQSPTQIPQVEKTELKELPKPEVLEEQIEKVPELREEPEEEETEDLPEPDSVTTPPEPIKEKRRKSRSSSVKELDESKSFALFGDWQPRRSERIFINSSVAPPSSADLSPLSSPTVKTSDLGWPKKTKRLSKGKKLSKTDSVSDVEPTEDEATPTSSKISTKQKKKKSPGKGKKRRSSSVTDPDFVLRTPKRKAAKRDRSYEEADEDDDEDMADEEDEDYNDDMEETEQTSQENQDEMLDEDSQSNKPEHELNDANDFEMKEERTNNTTPVETKNDGAIKSDNFSAGDKDNVSETDTVGEETVQENTSLENSKKESQKDVEKEKVSVKKDEDKEEKPDDRKESKKGMESVKVEDEKEPWSKKEKENKMEQEKTSGADKKEALPCEEEPATERSTKSEQSSSDELASISQRKKELPPEPVISFTKEELKENAKMLLPVDRVFYRGRIAFYQDPDLYGIVLPGERGRRPHLRSTEQLLSQAVKDVIPPAVEYLPIGTRVCAHWSPQYRCFYPGSVIETPPDEKSEVGKLWVEFDDGDSGIFPLSDLRKIKTKYPVQVEDVESDVVVPERRPRSSSRATSPSSTRRSRDHDTSLKNKDDDTSGWESSEDAPIKRSKGRGKRRVRLRTRDRRLSEEATDSDAPRGSRDSDFEDNVETSKCDSRTKIDNNKDIEAELKSSQVKSTKRERRRTKIRDDTNTSSQDKSKETSENAKRDSKVEKSGSKDKDRSKSNSNVQKQQDDDSDACDDNEGTQEAGTSRSRSRSSRLSELDLRKKSLTLNLNSASSLRSGNMERDSPMQDSTSQDEDSGSCSEVFDESPQTENKGFQPRLGKRRRSQLDKFRQGKSQGDLWQWSGKNYQNKRKGKGRKVFYKTIVRGDETISVGDCAVFTSNPSKSHNLPYVGMIENMWEGCSGNMVVKVKWFYHPEETKAGRRASDAKHSLYRSTHVDENDVQTISHKCEVVSPEDLKRRNQSHETIGTRSSTNDRSERLFCCVGTYDPSTEKIEST